MNLLGLIVISVVQVLKVVEQYVSPFGSVPGPVYVLRYGCPCGDFRLFAEAPVLASSPSKNFVLLLRLSVRSPVVLEVDLVGRPDRRILGCAYPLQESSLDGCVCGGVGRGLVGEFDYRGGDLTQRLELNFADFLSELKVVRRSPLGMDFLWLGVLEEPSPVGARGVWSVGSEANGGVVSVGYWSRSVSQV